MNIYLSISLHYNSKMIRQHYKKVIKLQQIIRKLQLYNTPQQQSKTKNTSMSSQQSDPDNNNPEQKKRRRGESRTSRQTPRYQCYCDKIYLSYPALYLHLKNKHPQCFLNNRKIQVTKFKETITHDGYKILKMEKDANQMGKGDAFAADQMFKPKNLSHFPFQNYHHFPYPVPQNFMMPSMDSKPFYMDSPLNGIQMPKNIPQNMPQSHSSFNPMSQPMSKCINEFKPQNQVQMKVPKIPKEDVLSMINQYIEEIVVEDQLQKIEIMEIELLYLLLPKCIREKSEKLLAVYNMSMDSEDLVKNSNLKYLESVLPYFREIYVISFVQKQRSGDDSSLSREEKLMKAMVRLNRYFNDEELMSKELQRFEQWLTIREVIDHVEQNVSL